MQARLLGAPDHRVLGFRPLYRQVRDLLVKKIADGVWLAGQALPSETEIAADLRVSQGTVRKALDALAADKLVVRRQGRGTYVAKHDDACVLSQFCKLFPDSGERCLPEVRIIDLAVETDRDAARSLGLPPRDEVLRIRRIGSFESKPCVAETVYLPAGLFPEMAGRDPPNNLYAFYAAEYGVIIGRASEKLKAVAALSDTAEALGIAVGTPLLRIDRTAYALDGRRIEWRVSLCRTDALHYWSDLK